MKQRMSISTLAVLGALALAALSRSLLPSDNVVYAADPRIRHFRCRPTLIWSVPENTPPGVNIGAPISATDQDDEGNDDLEFGNTLTYSLEGR